MKEVSIVVEISEDSEVQIEANGFSDAKCLAETEDLEKALGKVSGRSKKNHSGVSTGTNIKVGKA